MAPEEAPKRRHHRPEIPTSVHRAGICNAQPRIRIARRGRQGFRVDAVRHARNSRLRIPRGEGLGELPSAGENPRGHSEGAALQTWEDDPSHQPLSLGI